MASYAAAVDIFRSSAAAAAAAGGSGIEGVAAEDMAAMQALMEEDENNPDAFAMAEDESLDYDVRIVPYMRLLRSKQQTFATGLLCFALRCPRARTTTLVDC